MFIIFNFLKKKKQTSPDSFDVSDSELNDSLKDLKTGGSDEFIDQLEDFKKDAPDNKESIKPSESSEEPAKQQVKEEPEQENKDKIQTPSEETSDNNESTKPVKQPEEPVKDSKDSSEDEMAKLKQQSNEEPKHDSKDEPKKVEMVEDKDPFYKRDKEEKPEESKENVTKVEDENASFEIPDFSDEDLDFDLGLDDSDNNKDQEEVPKEEQHKDFNLPKFESAKQTSDELPVFSEVFVERSNYKKILESKNILKNALKTDNKLLGDISRIHKKEATIQSSINKNVEDIKHSLLYVDRKLFGEGDIYE